MFFRYSIACLLLCLISTYGTAKDNLPARYSVTPESWAPYWIVDDKSVEGILSDVMKSINSRLKNDIQPIEPLPLKRALIAFSKGDIEIECCVNLAWRQAPEQASVSVWSDTVMTAEEILIFPKNRMFPYAELSDLAGKNLATILGYGYVGDEYFIRNDVLKNTSLIRMVAARHVDAAIIDKFEFLYAIEHYPELEGIKDKLSIGPVINQSELKLRVHQSRTELLPPINEAIATMKKTGEFDKIFDSYVDDSSE